MAARTNGNKTTDHPPWQPPAVVRAQVGGNRVAQHVLSAAEQCFIELGASATLTDIARQAAVSRPTVYRYFDNREQIILEIGLRIMESFLDQALAEVASIEDPVKKVARAVTLLMDGRHPDDRPEVLADSAFFWETYAVVGQSPTYRDVVRAFLDKVFAQLPGPSVMGLDEVVEFVVRLVSTVPLRKGYMTDRHRREAFIERFVVAPILA